MIFSRVFKEPYQLKRYSREEMSHGQKIIRYAYVRRQSPIVDVGIYGWIGYLVVWMIDTISSDNIHVLSYFVAGVLIMILRFFYITEKENNDQYENREKRHN